MVCSTSKTLAKISDEVHVIIKGIGSILQKKKTNFYVSFKKSTFIPMCIFISIGFFKLFFLE